MFTFNNIPEVRIDHSVNNRTVVQLPLTSFTSASRLPCFYSVYEPPLSVLGNNALILRALEVG